MNPRIRPEDRARWKPGRYINGENGESECLHDHALTTAEACQEADHLIIRARQRARLTTPTKAAHMRYFVYGHEMPAFPCPGTAKG